GGGGWRPLGAVVAAGTGQSGQPADRGRSGRRLQSRSANDGQPAPKRARPTPDIPLSPTVRGPVDHGVPQPVTERSGTGCIAGRVASRYLLGQWGWAARGGIVGGRYRRGLSGRRQGGHEVGL